MQVIKKPKIIADKFDVVMTIVFIILLSDILYMTIETMILSINNIIVCIDHLL